MLHRAFILTSWSRSYSSQVSLSGFSVRLEISQTLSAETCVSRAELTEAGCLMKQFGGFASVFSCSFFLPESNTVPNSTSLLIQECMKRLDVWAFSWMKLCNQRNTLQIKQCARSCIQSRWVPTKTPNPAVPEVTHHLPLSVCVCVCYCCCRLEVSHSFEEFRSDAEQQPWWGFGFYLQVGGAEARPGSERVWETQGGKQKAWTREKQPSGLCVCSTRGQRKTKLTQLLHRWSGGGRFSFVLDVSAHSSHAGRFKGRVSLWFWLGSRSDWEEAFFRLPQHTHTHTQKSTKQSNHHVCLD